MINDEMQLLNTLAFVDSVELVGISDIPYAMIEEEMTDPTPVYTELQQVYALYAIYRYGALFRPKTSKGRQDTPPSDLRYKQASNLVKKEARFMFAKSPDIKVEPKTSGETALAKEEVAGYQSLIDAVLDRNNFSDRIIKAARDCFIGKRVAIMVNFNENGIQVSFIDALHFLYRFDDINSNELIKFVAYETVTDSDMSAGRRIFKKKYEKEDGGIYLEEVMLDGNNNVVRVVTPRCKVLLKRIPAYIILNDGLLSDTKGVSDIMEIAEPESVYSRISNCDIDAVDQNMNPTKYTVDMDENSTSGLVVGPGAYWDLHSDQASNEVHPGVGVIAPSMEHSEPVKATLARIKTMMYDALEIPDITTENLQGIVSSGKTLKAIYWPLIVRCDEKMKTWAPALRFMAEMIIEGSRLYPKSAAVYEVGDLPSAQYTIDADNAYPLPEDEEDEKSIDIMEVNAQLMSRRSYMEKWRGMTATESEEELRRIAEETNLLENGGMTPDVKQDEVVEDAGGGIADLFMESEVVGDAAGGDMGGPG